MSQGHARPGSASGEAASTFAHHDRATHCGCNPSGPCHAVVELTTAILIRWVSPDLIPAHSFACPYEAMTEAHSCGRVPVISQSLASRVSIVLIWAVWPSLIAWASFRASGFSPLSISSWTMVTAPLWCSIMPSRNSC